MLSRILTCVPTLSRVSIEALEDKNYLLSTTSSTDTTTWHASANTAHRSQADKVEDALVTFQTASCTIVAAVTRSAISIHIASYGNFHLLYFVFRTSGT